MTTPHRIRSEETWAKARADYLAGDTRAAVCERYDLGETAFKARARAEGWRRGDQPDPEPAPEAPPPPPRAFAETVEDALARADDAVLRGKPAEAQRWLALAERYEMLAWLEEDRLQSASIRLRRARKEAEAEAAAAAREGEAPKPPKPPTSPFIFGGDGPGRAAA